MRRQGDAGTRRFSPLRRVAPSPCRVAPPRTQERRNNPPNRPVLLAFFFSSIAASKSRAGW